MIFWQWSWALGDLFFWHTAKTGHRACPFAPRNRSGGQFYIANGQARWPPNGIVLLKTRLLLDPPCAIIMIMISVRDKETHNRR